MKMTKRILSIVLVVLMLFSASMVATSAAPDGFEIADKNVSEDAINGEVYGFVGDTDMSETVSVQDATLIQKYAAGLVTLGENQTTIADVNFDGRVNVKDATTIRKFLADLPVDAPIGQFIYIPGKEDNTDPTTPTTPTTPTNPTQPTVGDDSVTVYFINSANWATVNAYIWDADGNPAVEWPGTAMTKTDKQINGYDVYSFTFEPKYTNIIFNAGLDQAQTDDLTVQAGQYYYYKDATWYAKPEDVPAPDNNVIKIYFIKPSKWANACIYIMDGNGEALGTAYPGTKMELVEGDKYTYDVPADAGFIKFTDGTYVNEENKGENKRTENVAKADIVAGRTYEVDFDKPTKDEYGNIKENSWAVKWDVTPTDPVKIYFIKPSKWDNAYIHIIGGAGETTYPGVKMELVEGDKYTYTVPGDATKIKFTDGTYVNEENKGENKRTENVERANIKADRVYEVDFDKPTKDENGNIKDNSWAVKWTDSVVDDFVDVLGEIADATGDEIRVYFTRPSDWTGVYIYLIDDAGQALGTAYPGDKMVCVDVESRKYAFNVPGNAAEIKFTDGDYVMNEDGTTSGANKRTDNVAKGDIVKDRLYYIGKSLGGNKWEPDWDGKKKDVVEPGTVYFVNTANWGTVNAYVWNDGESPAWPGTAMTKTDEKVNGFDIYSFKTETAYANIIFNDGDGNDGIGKDKTANLKFEEGKYYYFIDAKWYNSKEEIPAPRTEDVTVYFIKPEGWDNACIYMMNGDQALGEAYPGKEMTLVEGDKYSYVVPAEATAIKFTDGNAENTKRTENVVGNDVVDGRTYEVDFDKPTKDEKGNIKDNSWAAKWDGKEEETTTAPTDPPVILEEDYYLVGEAFGGETGTLIPEGGLTYDLAAGNYKFKIKTSTGRVLGNGSNAVINDTTGEGNGWTFRENQGEVTLNATGAKYTFSITTLIENNEFKVKVAISAEFEKSGWSIIAGEGSEAVAKDFLASEGADGIYTYTTTLAAGTYKFRIQNATGETPVIYGSRASATDATVAAGIVFTTNNQAYDYTLNATGGKYTFTVNTTNVNAGTGAIMPKVTVSYEPITLNTVYFVNTGKWEEVAAYVWTGDGADTLLGAWPGTLMTKTADQVHGFDVYKIDVEGTPANIIFNSNGDSNKTGDLTFTVGKYYDCKSAKWYNSLSDIPAPAETFRFSLRGEGISEWNWNPGIEFNDNGDGTGTLVYTLAAGEYKFKIYDNETSEWLGVNSADGINDTFTGWTFANDRKENCKLIASGGVYTFKVYINPENKVKVDVTHVPTA